MVKAEISLNPVLHNGIYVFSTIEDRQSVPRELSLMEFVESEGVTVILNKEDADRLGLPYDYQAAWITLTLMTDLQAVGLTAKFSRALANEGISCNVIAAYHHDHIFVDYQNRHHTLKVLKQIRW